MYVGTWQLKQEIVARTESSLRTRGVEAKFPNIITPEGSDFSSQPNPFESLVELDEFTMSLKTLR